VDLTVLAREVANVARIALAIAARRTANANALRPRVVPAVLDVKTSANVRTTVLATRRLKLPINLCSKIVIPNVFRVFASKFV